MARKAVYLQGRTPGACGGAGSDVACFPPHHHAGQHGGRHVTHTADWQLGGTPGASGGADNGVVDRRSAFHPAAVHVPSFVVSL